MAYTYRLFLSWVIEQPALYEQVKHIVHVEDFLEEPYRQVAGLLYEQLERGQAEPAQIISRFEDVEEQRMVASGSCPPEKRTGISGKTAYFPDRRAE